MAYELVAAAAQDHQDERHRLLQQDARLLPEPLARLQRAARAHASVVTGATLANRNLIAIGVSGDGDTGSIGLGQFKHLMRRNVPMVYIIENNGVYGLTKGQFSATADVGQKLKYAGTQRDCRRSTSAWKRSSPGCGFVAR